MWSIYNDLIENIPENIYVEDYVCGDIWSMVKAGGNVGLAMTIKIDTIEKIHIGSIIGEPLKEIAKCSKSWNFVEAAMGIAAINAFYNTGDIIKSLMPIDGQNFQNDAFDAYFEEMKGKNVAVIGHFPYIERKLESICNLTILEKQPLKGDYPDSACEYILKEQDFVFITGSTLVNKTLPRLLQIASNNTKIILLGPSVPMTPLLYKYGISSLSGFYVTDTDKIKEIITRNTEHFIFEAGDRVNFINS